MLLEHIPLEQGLRLESVERVPCVLDTLRAYSIRTRIKTLNTSSIIRNFCVLLEHIPLEQGLRLDILATVAYHHEALLEHIPLEQGLRLS